MNLGKVLVKSAKAARKSEMNLPQGAPAGNLTRVVLGNIIRVFFIDVLNCRMRGGSVFKPMRSNHQVLGL